MDTVLSWKLIGITIFVYYLNCNLSTAVAGNIESESDVHDSFEQPKIWSPLLEELAIKCVILFDNNINCFIQWLKC